MALNVLHGHELAWQERKAPFFTASSRFIGCGNLLWKDEHGEQRVGCFRPTEAYASGASPSDGGRGAKIRKGMSLGSAMTLSGAAASPNMGYHSSPVSKPSSTSSPVTSWLIHPLEIATSRLYAAA